MRSTRYEWLSLIVVISAVVLFGGLTACSLKRNPHFVGGRSPEIANPSASQIFDPADRAFEDARLRWRNANISSYDMTISLEMTSFVEPARMVQVKVRRGDVLSMQVVDEQDRRGGLSFYDKYKTVDLIFYRIPQLKQEGGTVEVDYNSIYGYPEKIRFAKVAADASFTFKVLHFELVNAEN